MTKQRILTQHYMGHTCNTQCSQTTGTSNYAPKNNHNMLKYTANWDRMKNLLRFKNDGNQNKKKPKTKNWRHVCVSLSTHAALMLFTTEHSVELHLVSVASDVYMCGCILVLFVCLCLFVLFLSVCYRQGE